MTSRMHGFKKYAAVWVCAVMVLALFNVPGKASAAVPSPWSEQDIGSPGAAGSASVSGGTYTVAGGGADIFGTSDQFHYVYQALSGDGSIVARVTSITNTSTWAKGAVMIRDGLTAGAANATTLLTQGNGAQFTQRSTAGGTTAFTNFTGVSAPYWMKIARTGSTFTSSISSNGTSWTTVGTATITMGTNVYIGLAVTAISTTALNTSIFTDVTVAGGSTGGSTGGGTTNLAIGKTATASSTQSPNTPNLAIDGNGTSTRWAADFTGDPQWIYVDLGSAQTVGRVVLKWETAYADVYKIQASSTATSTSWTDVASITAGDGGTDDISFTPTSTRYIRMYGTHRASTYSYSLYEFEIYGSGTPDTSAPTVPTGLTSPGKTSTSVTLSWTASTDNVGVTGYDVYRGGTTLCGTTSSTTLVCSGLTASTAYSFTVKAHDAAGNSSSASAALSVTTNAASANRSGLPWKSGVFKTAQDTPSNINVFETWRGRLVDTITDFTYRTTWAQINNSVQVQEWDGKPYQLVLAVPFFPEDGMSNFAACAAGNYNANWQSFGSNLVTHHLANTIVRLGWEFNGNWFNHSVTTANMADWKTCFQNVVTSIRATDSSVKIDWNVNRGSGMQAAGNADPALVYPGDSYVDYIGIDTYDMWEPALNQASWDSSHMGGSYGIQHWIDFATNHGKQVSFPEWGLNHGDVHHGNDNPFYINKMWALFNSLNSSGKLAYEAYYDEGPGGILSALDVAGMNPNGASAYLADY